MGRDRTKILLNKLVGEQTFKNGLLLSFFLVVEAEGESEGVAGLALGVVDVEGGGNDEAGVSVEALGIGKGELAVSVELALDGGVNVELVASTNCELGGGSGGLVQVEGGLKPSTGSGGDSVEVGNTHLVLLEDAEEGEDPVVGGVGSSAVHSGEGSTLVLGLETHRESLISDHASKAGLGSLVVQHINGTIEGEVLVLVLSVELDGVEFLGVNL